MFFVIAKFTDFILGKVGRKYVKEKIIFNPWYKLESNPLHEAIHSAAAGLENTYKFLFGSEIVTFRAFITWLIIPQVMAPLVGHYFEPVEKSSETWKYAAYCFLSGFW